MTRFRTLTKLSKPLTMTSLNVTACPPDPIFALSGRYKEDSFPKKVDLGIGAYRDDKGQPWVLPVVRKVEQMIVKDPHLNHEYLPMRGNDEFRKAACKTLFGNDVNTDIVSTIQTLSGTGANHIGAELLKKFPPHGITTGKIWIPTPTWGNHKSIFDTAGLEYKEYPYWNSEAKEFNVDGMLNAINTQMQKGDTILLHACAHNPTGMDPTRDQWKQISDAIKQKELFVFFDSAYQGFASGDLDNDAWAVRYFVSEKHDLLVCQSFSKNMGIYGERCGCLHVYLKDTTPEVADAILSQLASQTRAEISTTPAFGSRVAAKILTDPELLKEWYGEVRFMADRIISMRHALRSKLEALNTPGKWSHITEQIGMFSFVGLSKEQCERLVNEFHIYLLPNSRISVAGLNTHNVDYVAESIHKVVTN